MNHITRIWTDAWYEANTQHPCDWCGTPCHTGFCSTACHEKWLRRDQLERWNEEPR